MATRCRHESLNQMAICSTVALKTNRCVFCGLTMKKHTSQKIQNEKKIY